MCVSHLEMVGSLLGRLWCVINDMALVINEGLTVECRSDLSLYACVSMAGNKVEGNIGMCNGQCDL